MALEKGSFKHVETGIQEVEHVSLRDITTYKIGTFYCVLDVQVYFVFIY